MGRNIESQCCFWIRKQREAYILSKVSNNAVNLLISGTIYHNKRYIVWDVALCWQTSPSPFELVELNLFFSLRGAKKLFKKFYFLNH